MDRTDLTHVTPEQGKGRLANLLASLGVYAVGNIGSKLITFLMVPLYTHYVDNTADFGYYDLCLTVCFVLLPFVTLQLRDGSFRFLMDSESDQWRQRVVTFTYRALATGIAVSLALAFLASLWMSVRHLWLAVGLLVAMSLQEVVQQVFRGLGHNRAFVAVGILTAFGVGLLSVLLVAWLGMGVEGIFWANILARLFALAAVESRVGTLRRYFRVRVPLADLPRQMLRYSLPLLPGTLCWWAMGSSDRWFISELVSLEQTGVYAVAARMVSVVTTLALIFYQAWQETALRQYDSADRDVFFTRIFNGYLLVLTALVALFSLAMKWAYPWLVAGAYGSSLRYVLPLTVSAAMFAVVAFFDLGYQCAKDTARTLPAIIAGALVNVSLNLLLAPCLHTWGVVVTALVTNAVLIAWRWRDMRRYMTLRLHRATLCALPSLALTAVAFYASWPLWAEVAALIAALAVIAAAVPRNTWHQLQDKARQRLAARHNGQ